MATTRTGSKLPKLRFPELTENATDTSRPGRTFWLSAWMREQAAKEALEALAYSKAIDSTTKPALFHGLCISVYERKASANRVLNQLIANGGLLYAWHGTTALDSGVPV